MAAVVPDWLGRPEGPELEYKAAGALRHPETLVRAVVGFLNAGARGCLVVGVDDGGLVQGVADAASQRDRLQSLLLDRIDPRPVGRVEVRVVPVQGREVLEAAIQPEKAQRPWFEKRSGMLGPWRRQGAMTIPMSADEVLLHDKPSKGGPPWHEGLETVAETRLVLQASALDPSEVEFDRSRIETLLDPHHRGTLQFRGMGWSVVGEMRSARGLKKTIEIGRRGERRWTSIRYRDGIVRFEGSEAFLRFKQPSGIEEPVIYPYPLVEGTATFFLLLARLADAVDLTGPVLCELGLWRAAGWRLGPYGPGSLGWGFSTHTWTDPYPDDVLEERRETTWKDIREQPDMEAFPLVQGVYESFGYEEGHIPFWSPNERRFRF